MDGQTLFRTIIQATGLPAELIESELSQMLAEKGITIESMTLDDLRETLAFYLQETLLKAKAVSR